MIFDVWTDERESAFPIEAHDMRDAAINGAEHYFHHCDGWESHWPVTFRVALPGCGVVVAYSVDMEAQPHFYTYEPIRERAR